MINALLTIALVQSLGFAADLRLALRGDGFDDGFNLNALDSLNDPLHERLFLSGLPLLRLRLAQLIFGFKTGLLGQPERRSFRRSFGQSGRQSGREIWQCFAASTPC